MNKISKEERLETKGYLLGISEGLFDAMRYATAGEAQAGHERFVAK